MTNKPYPPAYPHDPIAELFENVYWVHGSIKAGPAAYLNRNMLILRDGADLTLINPVRLNDEELKKLNQLGTVRHVIRLGFFHGLDDRFYVDTYNAEFWCQPNQPVYDEPNASREIGINTVPPISDAEFFIFESATCPEAALLIKKHKLLITTDSVQYWPNWSRTSWISQLFLKLAGFRNTLQIGGPWLKRVTPKGGSLNVDFEKLLQLDFESLISAHGALLRHTAKTELTEVVKKRFSA